MRGFSSSGKVVPFATSIPLGCARSGLRHPAGVSATANSAWPHPLALAGLAAILRPMDSPCPHVTRCGASQVLAAGGVKCRCRESHAQEAQGRRFRFSGASPDFRPPALFFRSSLLRRTAAALTPARWQQLSPKQRLPLVVQHSLDAFHTTGPRRSGSSARLGGLQCLLLNDLFFPADLRTLIAG